MRASGAMNQRLTNICLLVLLITTSAHASSLYVRAALGIEHTGDTTVRDVDCSSTNPPALFGCVDGNDGRPLAAYGDLGRSAVAEFAIGREFGTRARVELSLASRDVDLEAEANF